MCFRSHLSVFWFPFSFHLRRGDTPSLSHTRSVLRASNNKMPNFFYKIRILVCFRSHLSVFWFPFSSNRLSLNDNVRRSHSFMLRANQKKVLFPGEFVELQAPSELQRDAEISLEPRCDSVCTTWPLPAVTNVVEGTIRIISNEPRCYLLKYKYKWSTTSFS